jgi:hypothetical protein
VKKTRQVKRLWLGTLHFGTFSKTGKLELIYSVKERKIDIFGVSKTKWTGQGMKKLREECEIIWSSETT